MGQRRAKERRKNTCGGNLSISVSVGMGSAGCILCTVFSCNLKATTCREWTGNPIHRCAVFLAASTNKTSWAERFRSNERGGTLNVAASATQIHEGPRPIPIASLSQRHLAAHGVSADNIRIDQHEHSPPSLASSRVAEEVAIRDVVPSNVWEKRKLESCTNQGFLLKSSGCDGLSTKVPWTFSKALSYIV